MGEKGRNMRSGKRSVVRLFLAVVLLSAFALLAVSCGTDYSGDARIGTYENAEGYTLVLKANGRGMMRHTSTYGTVTEESILFDFEKDGTLVLHGTEESGGVIGRTEFYGKPAEKDGVYRVTLRAVESGLALGEFVQKAK